MSGIPRGDDLTHAGRIKRLEERLDELSRRDTVIADPAGVPRDIILLNDVTVPTVQAAITDGLPPASSPAAEVIGGIGSLFIRWTPVANANPVTYKVYVDTVTGFTPAPGNLVGSTGASSLTVRTLTAGAALTYGTTYYAKIVASDADGSAAAGAEGSGSMLQVDAPDIALGAITATKLSADAIDGKTITGTVIRSAAAGEHIEINGAGLAHSIGFYTGDAGESTPGLLQPTLVDIELAVTLWSPGVQLGGPTTTMTLATGKGTTRSRFAVDSQDIYLNGAVKIGGASVPVATTTDTQTLTNKTLTSPTVSSPTITGATTFGGGSPLSRMRFGAANLATTSTASNVVVTHGLGVVPGAVLLGQQSHFCRVQAQDSTTFTVEARLPSSNALLATGTSVLFFWMAIA